MVARMSKSGVRALFLIAICLPAISLLGGCIEYGTKGSSDFPEHLMVNFTANTAGSIFPCGCRIPLGGLSRRGGVLAQESPYPQLTVDAGSFAGTSTGYDRFAAGFILQACAEMGYHAVNLGVRESTQPVSQIRDWDRISGGLLVSANLLDDQGLPVTRTYIIREIGGIKVGITGATAPGYRPPEVGEMPEVIPPIPPLEEVQTTFEEEGVQFFVLLADLNEAEVASIVNEIPEIDLVIAGQGFNPGEPMRTFTFDSGARMVKMGGYGKYVGRLRLDFEPDGTVIGEEAMRVDLDSTVPTLSSITEMLLDFKTELAARREEFLGDPTNPFQRNQSAQMVDVLTGYAGYSFCDSCHLSYRLETSFMKHEMAWNALDNEHRTDPACLPCHTTGWGVPTGLEDPYRDTHLRGVSCEACHGPAAGHVREKTILKEGLDPSMMLPYVDPTGVPFTREVPEEVCLRCHTEEWTPDFDYETWIDRVRHTVEQERPVQANPITGEPLREPDLPEDMEVPSEN